MTGKTVFVCMCVCVCAWWVVMSTSVYVVYPQFTFQECSSPGTIGLGVK